MATGNDIQANDLSNVYIIHLSLSNFVNNDKLFLSRKLNA